MLLGWIICWLRGKHNFQWPASPSNRIDSEQGGFLYFPSEAVKVCTLCGKPKE